jgi:hypothetical protein
MGAHTAAERSRGGGECGGAGARGCRRPPACRRRARGLPAAYALLAAALAGRALAEGPTLQPVPDVIIKACGNPLVAAMACPGSISCQDGEAHLILGHSGADKDCHDCIVMIESVSPAIGSPQSPLRNAVVRTVSGQKKIDVCPRGKASGRTTITIRVTDPVNSKYILTDFAVVVQPLDPVFDNAGPTRFAPAMRLRLSLFARAHCSSGCA